MTIHHRFTTPATIDELGYRLFRACVDDSGADYRLNIYLSFVHFARLEVKAADLAAFEDECVNVAQRLGLLRADPAPEGRAYIPSRYRNSEAAGRKKHSFPERATEAEVSVLPTRVAA